MYGIVWMCVPNDPLFPRCQVYDWPLSFQQKVVDWSHFLWISIWKAPLFWCIPVHAHFFRSEIFRGYLFSWYSVNWLLFCLTTSNKWVQNNLRAVYEWVNISDDLVYEWVLFFQRPGIWLGKVSKYWLEHPYQNYLQFSVLFFFIFCICSFNHVHTAIHPCLGSSASILHSKSSSSCRTIYYVKRHHHLSKRRQEQQFYLIFCTCTFRQAPFWMIF